MIMSKKPLVSDERKRLIGSIIFGSICIILGATFVDNLVKEYSKHNMVGAVIYFILIITFLFLGIFQLTAKLKEELKADAIAEPGTKSNRRYEEKRAKAIENQTKELYSHGDIRTEFYAKQAKTSLIGCAIVLIIVMIFCYFYITVENSEIYSMFMVLVLGLGIYCICSMAYPLFGVRFNSIKASVNKLGLDYTKVNEDFVGGKCFKLKKKLLCVGKMYTVYSDGTSSIVFENSQISGVSPYCKETYRYNNLIYSCKKSNYYVIATLKDGSMYYLNCRQFIDEMIIEEYLNQNRNNI